MDFPEESILQAKDIAKKYDLRNHSQIAKAKFIYNGNFVHLQYGFNDALKSGKCGVFLHEAKKDADCFSLLGMDYLIAREASLQPRMFWASTMRDVKEGQSEIGSFTADHSFLIVKINGNDFIIDPFLQTFGEVKFVDHTLKIINMSNNRNEQITRKYESLTELTEDDYLKLIHENRSPGGGERALAAGQKISIRDNSVHIQYISAESNLVTFMLKTALQPIPEELPGKRIIYELCTKLSANGKLSVDEGEIHTYEVVTAGWRKEQHRGVHRQIILDYTTVKKYLNHLDKAAKHFGRKGPLFELSAKSYFKYFEERGFSVLGEITKNNGVDSAEHEKLLEKIRTAVNKVYEEEEFMPSIILRAKYFNDRMENISKNNPEGLIYSDEIRKKFIDSHIEMIREDISTTLSSAVVNRLLAMAKLVPNLKEKLRVVNILHNKNDEITRFTNALELNRRYAPDFHIAIDFSIYQLKHPLGTQSVTSKELSTFYMSEVHEDMLDYIVALPCLELKSYRKGLQRILSN